jgi:hypothetical protein
VDLPHLDSDGRDTGAGGRRAQAPLVPPPARTTFAPNAFASRSAPGAAMSVRVWNIVVRLRVEV